MTMQQELYQDYKRMALKQNSEMLPLETKKKKKKKKKKNIQKHENRRLGFIKSFHKQQCSLRGSPHPLPHPAPA